MHMSVWDKAKNVDSETVDFLGSKLQELDHDFTHDEKLTLQVANASRPSGSGRLALGNISDQPTADNSHPSLTQSVCAMSDSVPYQIDSESSMV